MDVRGTHDRAGRLDVEVEPVAVAVHSRFGQSPDLGRGQFHRRLGRLDSPLSSSPTTFSGMRELLRKKSTLTD